MYVAPVFTALNQAHALRELLILLRRQPPDAATLETAPLFPSPESYLNNILKTIYFSACSRAEPVASSKLWAADRQALLRLLLETTLPPPHSNVFGQLSADRLRGWLLNATQTLIRTWNNAHDPMQKLPAELWLACLPDMSQSERCELLRVSSFWRARLSRELPELWKTLDILQCTDHCAELFLRSATFPLSIKAEVHGPLELRNQDRALKEHAGRLRALHLDVSLEDPHAEYDMALSVRTAFRYAVPELESLSLTATQWPAIKLSKFFLLGDAPSLRTVHLAGVPLRADCAALRNATAVRLEGKVANLDALFDVVPAMTELEICRPRHRTVLPPIPSGAPLTSVSVSGNRTSPPRPHPLELLHESYLRLERVHVAMPDAGDLVRRTVKLAARQGLRSALKIASDLSIEHVAEDRDGRTRTVSTGAFKEARRVGTILENLAVRDLTLTDVAALRLYGEFTLPLLEHLTTRFTEVHSSWKPNFALHAPQLHTVEFAGDWPIESAKSRDAFLRDSLGVDEGHGEMLLRVDPERARTIPRRASDMYSYYASCTAAFSCDDGSWL